MSLKSRLSRVEEFYLGRANDRDPDFPYVVTGEVFATRCKDIYTIVQSLTGDVGDPAKSPLSDQSKQDSKPDSVLQDGSDPLEQEIRSRVWLKVLTLKDWYEAFFDHLLKYPHMIEFPLEQFGLQEYHSKVSSLPHIQYVPA